MVDKSRQLWFPNTACQERGSNEKQRRFQKDISVAKAQPVEYKQIEKLIFLPGQLSVIPFEAGKRSL